MLQDENPYDLGTQRETWMEKNKLPISDDFGPSFTKNQSKRSVH